MRTLSKIALRPATQVMRLSRLGSLHQCRLSFMRQLTRCMAKEGWHFYQDRFDIDSSGVGVAIYCAKTQENIYSLVAFAHDLPADQRSDRVIAKAWDATFTLFDGIPTDADIMRLRKNVPLQEAGRVSQSELSVLRTNRSVRLWDYMLDCLAQGKQPEKSEVSKVGYLMRATAVYGSGKFGAADRVQTSHRQEMRAPFQIELLSVYLSRWFALDLLNHMAKVKGAGKSVSLNMEIADSLGIGNSTGLGMAPFMVNHPILLNNWILARENAIATVRSLNYTKTEDIALFHSLYERSKFMVANWHSDHEFQIQKITDLKDDFIKIDAYLEQNFSHGLAVTNPWDGLVIWSQTELSEEGQELINSLILEPYGELVDPYGREMEADETPFAIDGRMKIAQLITLLKERFAWALAIDWENPKNRQRCWYISQEKLEPRLGERFEEANIADYEQAYAPAYDAMLLYHALGDYDKNQPVGDFLREHPQHRHMVRRIQICINHPYAEILDNLIGSSLMPIDMLRAKLSFFGATKFDPRSDRWLRITMYANAPYPCNITVKNADYWVYPQVMS